MLVRPWSRYSLIRQRLQPSRIETPPVDTNIPPQASDTTLIRVFQQIQRPYLVVGTKCDRVGQNALAKSLKALRETHEVSDILPVSAEKGTGIQELWKRLEAIAEN